MSAVRRTSTAIAAVLAAFAVIAATVTSWAAPPASTLVAGAAPADTGPRPAAAAAATRGMSEAEALNAFADLPLTFVENQGQTDEQVRYHAQGADFAFYLAPEQVLLSFTKDPAGKLARHDLGTGTGQDTGAKDTDAEAEKARGVNLALRFLGADDDVAMGALAPSDTHINYVRGDEQADWRTGLTAYGQVVYRDLWPGIDMLVQGDDGALKYEFHVQPGARPRDIRLAYAGAQGLRLEDSGDLLIRTPLGRLQDAAPVSYQEIDGERVAVDSRYVLPERQAEGKRKAAAKRTNRYGFAVGAYDRSETLVIDPALDYSTFVGGASADSAGDLAVDANGNAILVGTTQSSDFPATPGAFDQTFNGGIVDVFVAKLNADGSGLVYATYLGGVPTPTRRGVTDPIDNGRAIAVDAAGNAYITGQTASGNFPITPGAFQTTQLVGENTATEGFVSKLGPTGTLEYSTFLGGIGSDDGRSIAVDDAGNAYIGGSTFSADFPTTAGAFDTVFDGGEEVFVAKLNATGSDLLYSTFLGGPENELTSDIAIDATGNAYVIGSTRSVQFPTTPGSFQPTHSGGDFVDLFEVFVTKVNPTASGLVYSTFLGGNKRDFGGAIAVDSTGAAFVNGGTLSPTFPTTPGAFDTTFDGSSEGFITKLNPAGSALDYSTFFTGASDLALDSAGNLWVAGGADASAPTTPDAYQPVNNGGSDVYLAQLNATGSAIDHATFFGGPGNEGAGALAIDPLDNIYLAGTTTSASFPTTPGAFDRVWNGDASIFWGDAWVAEFAAGDAAPNAQPTVSITSPAAGAQVDGTVPVTAEAADADGTVSEVTFFVDSQPIGTDTTAPYSIDWDTTTVFNDFHTLTASAVDNAGRIGGSAPVQVSVFNPAPPITSTFSNEIDKNQTVTHSVSSGEGPVEWTLSWDEDDRIDMSLRALDPNGNVVDFDDSAAAPKSGTFQATVTGAYTFQVINNTDRDTTYTLTVTRPDPTAPPPPGSDVVRPEVRVTSPAGNSTVSGTVPITATATDNVGVERVEFIVNDSVTIATDNEPPYETAWDTTAFPDGLSSISARAFDAAGNAGTNRIPVTVDNTAEPPDTTAPTVSISSPADGATVIGTTDITATATDAVGVSQVEFFADGTSLGVDTTAPYQVSWDTTTVANGPHTLTASASDAAGNTGDSAAVNVTVDNAVQPPADTTAPTVTIDNPADGATVLGTTDVTATATDAVGVTQVEFFADNTSIGVDTTAPYELSWDTTTVANGAHTLTATASDAAGNTGDSAAVNVTVDNPVVVEPVTDTFSGEIRNQTLTHTVTSGVGPVDWTLTWDEDRVDLTLEVRDPAGNVVDRDATTGVQNKSGSFQATVAGDYTFRIVDNGDRGAEYTLSVTHPDTSATPPQEPADTTSPEVGITSPLSGTAVSGTTDVTAAATDESGVTEVEFFADGLSIGTDTTAPFGVSWDTTGLTDGSHALTATATDAAGNSGDSAAVTVEVDNTVAPPADTTAPTVTLTSPAANEPVSGTVALAATASDEVGVTEVRFFADGTPVGTDTSAPYTASWDSTAVADGSHELTATAVDAAGNTGESAIVTVTVDNAVDPPGDTTAPTVTLTSPAAGATVSGAEVAVTATAADAVGVTEVRFFADGVQIGVDATSPYGATWDTTTLANGTHTLTASAFDAAGNVGSAEPVTVTVDNPVEPPAPERTTTSFSGEIDDNQTMTHTVAAGVGTLDWALDWDETRVNLRLRVLDPSGNVVAAQNAASKPKVGSVQVPVAGQYTFEVITTSDRDAEYTLDVTHSVP